MESTSARDLDRRLSDLVRSERHLVVQFVVELAGFAKRELYRELGYTSLFYYCVRQLGLSKSSAFRRSEVARLIARFPVIADRLTAGSVSIRALVELREVLTEENQAEVLARAEGKSQEEAQLLAVAYKPRPVPRDVVRTLPRPQAPTSASPVVPAETEPPPLPPVAFALGPAETNSFPLPPVAFALVPAEAKSPPSPPEVVKPLTPDLRRLNVTVSAEFMAELERVRAALSHQFPDGNFEQVVREAFKLVLERDRKRKALTDRPRRQQEGGPRAQREAPAENNRYVPAAVRRAVWERDQGRCTWPMGDGKLCGSTHRLELDHDLEVALGGKAVTENIRLLCKGHNLMKAEQHLGRALMAKFRKDRQLRRDPPSSC
jgi:hypothetical protein